MVRMMSPRSPIRRSVSSTLRRADPLGQTELAELSQASRTERLVESIRPMCLDHAVFADPAHQRPVDQHQPFLLDLRTQCPFDIADRPRAEIEIDQFGSALAHACCQIIARDHQIGAEVILATHDDMGVGRPVLK